MCKNVSEESDIRKNIAKKKEMLMKYIKHSPSVICIMPLDDKSER